MAAPPARTAELAVAWERGPWLAVVKPAGLPVFPPHADPAGDCVLRRLLALLPGQAEPDWPFGFAGGIAHRLDNPTSGQLLVARDPDALAALRERFRRKELRKRYVFLTARDVPWDEHTVRRRIAHDRRRKGRMVVERGRDTPHRGRWFDAETRFRRIGRVAPGLVAWLAEMRTGVTHQVRLHAAFAGIALAGDRRYGGGALAWPRPEGATFLLHHAGVVGPDFDPPVVGPPAWWPRVLVPVEPA